MELKEIVKSLKKHLKLILGVTLGLTVLGAISYLLLPKTYSATGSFYIQREVENSQGQFFSYEGYYSQQTANNYTETVIGILESTDVRKTALEKLGITVNEESLRKSGRQVNVKRSAPQLVTLTVKGKSTDEAERLWGSLSQTTLESISKLNQKSDPLLHVTTVGEPVVKQNFSSLWVNTLAGLAAGLLFGTLGAAALEYFKEDK